MSVTKLDETELAARATSAVQQRFPGGSITNVVQLVGGTSSFTYLADLNMPTGAGGEARQAVIKAAPPGLERIIEVRMVR